MCRIMCQPRSESQSAVEAPVILLPSMSPYQPAPSIHERPDTEGERVLLGRSIHSVVDIDANIASGEKVVYAVGVPIFPDDELNDN